MEQSEDKKYALLSQTEFFSVFKDTFNLVKDEYYFITKAYYEKDDVVAVYKEEADKDCFFQLPEYRSKLVPHERRFIYFLPKGNLEKVTKSKAPDGRFNISTEQLVMAADPYGDGIPLKLPKEKISTTTEKHDVYSQLPNLSKTELLMLIVKASTELLVKE